MIKGCQKKIVFLKDTGSDFFEEAYFVIKPDYDKMDKNDILCEATKIASGIYPEKHIKKCGYGFLILPLGMIIGALITVGCFLLFA